MAMSNNQMVNPISGQVRKSFAPPNLVGKKRMCDIVPRLVRLGLGICWARAVLKKKNLTSWKQIPLDLAEALQLRPTKTAENFQPLTSFSPLSTQKVSQKPHLVR